MVPFALSAGQSVPFFFVVLLLRDKLNIKKHEELKEKAAAEAKAKALWSRRSWGF